MGDDSKPGALVAVGGTHSELTYVRHGLGHPTSLALLVVGLAYSACMSSVVGALITVAIDLMLVFAVSRTGIFRRAVDRDVASDERRKRNDEREQKLVQADIFARQRFGELSGLVDEIERSEPALADRFELQALLDHYCGLAVAHERCAEAMRRADRGALARELERGRSKPSSARLRRRLEIIEHRIRCWDETERRAEELSEELAAVAEFIHLVAQRAACPWDDFEVEAELERRLWDFEEQEDALRQLSAA
jgi:hypothetical protein